ncbi:MAG: antitoxin, RHH family protein [Atribacterota bacterium]|nr:antitoxin, RHH family protein [Atribacterota bacterium]
MSNQRTLVSLEPPVRDLIKKMAKERGISISSLCRDLVFEGLEILEDRYFDLIASQREKDFNWEDALSHEEVWNKG